MMECTTGLTDDEFDGLLAWLREEGVEGYPPILGLSGSLRATLMYLRQNIVQAVIGEILGVSQPTVSRAIKALTEAISRTRWSYCSPRRRCPRTATTWWTAPSSPAWTGASAAICGRSSTDARA